MWNGDTVPALGKCKVKVCNKKASQKWNVDYVVVDNKHLTPLLSRKAAEVMGFVTVHYDNFESVHKVAEDVSPN